jgi:hypothetical protein
MSCGLIGQILRNCIRPDREIAIFDEPDDLLLMPGFAQGLALTVGEVFGWLVD